MDVAAFDGWLSAIAALTPRQRQRAVCRACPAVWG